MGSEILFGLFIALFLFSVFVLGVLRKITDVQKSVYSSMLAVERRLDKLETTLDLLRKEHIPPPLS